MLPSDLQVGLLDFVKQDSRQSQQTALRLRRDVLLYFGTRHNEFRTEVESGRFLSEFYLAISACQVRLPPLQERLQDLPVLMNHFLDHIQPGGERLEIHPEVLEVFMAYSWPYNLAELKQVLTSAAASASGGLIATRDLPSRLLS